MSDRQQNMNSNFWKRAWWVYLFFLLLAACIVATTVKVSFVDGEHWRRLAQNQTLRSEEVSAVRGNIYSSDNALLAVSVPIFTVRMDVHPSVVCNDTFYKYLRPLCDSLHKMYPAVSSQSFRNTLLEARKKKKRNLLIKNKVTYSELDRMRHFPIFNKGQYRGGFVVEEKERRSRPNGILAARTIGYYNAESKTGVGLERAYNKELQGISGHRVTQRVAQGVWRPVYSADEVKPENGQDLITTLDIRIQDVTEAALQRCMEGNEAEHGCAVVMEVKTGKVVAMANLTKQADGTYAESQNYAVGEAVEPGSIFKLASTIAILEESKEDVTKRIVPTGEMKFYNRWMKDSHRGGWGDIPFSEAFEKSSNVGISYLANEIFHANQQKFVDYLYKMRLNKPLGVEIPGEGEPYIKNTKDKTWSGVSLPWMSIGYEVKVTPLQMLNLYNAVANNGKMMKPMFVSAIRKGSETVRALEPQVLVESICSKSTLSIVQRLLQGVVESGTGTVLQNPLYKVAAKTGTAQMNYGKGQKITYRASIVGYFPAESPRYSCIVMITSPQGGRYYGGSVAGPVFNDIAQKIYATLMQGGREIAGTGAYMPYPAAGYAADIQAVHKYMGEGVPELEPTAFVRKNTATAHASDGFNEVIMAKDVVPDLRGMGLRDASFLLERCGLKTRVYGKGRVKRQEPAAGSPCVAGQTVVIELG